MIQQKHKAKLLRALFDGERRFGELKTVPYHLHINFARSEAPIIFLSLEMFFVVQLPELNRERMRRRV